MRAAVRPFLLFAFLCVFTTYSQSQPAKNGQYNLLLWSPGSPSPLVGGVNASVDITPAAGWTCTEVTIRVIDAATNKTLGDYTADNPKGNVTKTFTGLPNRLNVRVTADSVFQNGALFDFKQIEGFVVTQ
jgi:hypothetical protein